MLTDSQLAVLEPSVETVRPHAKRPPAISAAQWA